jgi:hypothetical protein
MRVLGAPSRRETALVDAARSSIAVACAACAVALVAFATLATIENIQTTALVLAVLLCFGGALSARDGTIQLRGWSILAAIGLAVYLSFGR